LFLFFFSFIALVILEMRSHKLFCLG
jgi:hypothetical protein